MKFGLVGPGERVAALPVLLPRHPRLQVLLLLAGRRLRLGELSRIGLLHTEQNLAHIIYIYIHAYFYIYIYIYVCMYTVYIHNFIRR